MRDGSAPGNEAFPKFPLRRISANQPLALWSILALGRSAESQNAGDHGEQQEEGHNQEPIEARHDRMARKDFLFRIAISASRSRIIRSNRFRF
jgi:hypothetical protein